MSTHAPRPAPAPAPATLNWHTDWRSGGDLTLLSSDEVAFSVPSRPILAVS